MTQPEQEAREMLAAEYDEIGDGLNAGRIRSGAYVCEEVDVALGALTKALARPTAGIDRAGEPVAYLKSWKATEDGSNRVRVDRYLDCEPWLVALNPTIEALYRAPAKTGERGAVIEEKPNAETAQARFESTSNPRGADQAAEGSQGSPQAIEAQKLAERLTADADGIVKAWDRRYAPEGVGAGIMRPVEVDTMREAAAFLRALSQPLPDAPIGGEEG